MSPFKRVALPAIVAITLTLAVSSDRATAVEATDPVEQDWLHQADGRPTSSRIRREITWTRELSDRLVATGNGPDLAAELKELDALERRLPDSDPTQPKPKTTPTQLLPEGLVARWAFDQTEKDGQATIHGASEVARGVGGDLLRLDGKGYV